MTVFCYIHAHIPHPPALPRSPCAQLLHLRGHAFNQSADFDTIQKMKEKLCYVAYDVEKETELALNTTCLVKKYSVGCD